MAICTIIHKVYVVSQLLVLCKTKDLVEDMRKNKNFLQSIRCAVRGIYDGFQSERNFKIYCVIATLFFIGNIALKVSRYEYCLFIILTAMVFLTEYINTSIERIVDTIGKEIKEDYRFIKDVAAGAVLVSGIAFFIVEGILLLPYIM